MTAKKLTAEELAVKMEMGNHDWADDAADMLRQQQAEIGCYKIELELHKAMIQDLEKGLASSITLNKAQAEIEALKLRELTDEEIISEWIGNDRNYYNFARAILKKASEK